MNLGTRLYVPELVPHPDLNRLEVGVELELAVGLVHVGQCCEVGGEPALQGGLEEEDVPGTGGARQLLHKLDHLLQVVHTLMALLSEKR